VRHGFREFEMKKLLYFIVVALVAVVAGTWFWSPFREYARPHLPLIAQNFLPAPAVVASGDGTSKRGVKGSGAPIAVSVVAAVSEDLPIIESTYGVVKSPSVAAINSRITSQITHIHVKDGQMVKAGDPLISLDDSLLKAQLAKDEAGLQRDQAILNGADLELVRAKGLAIKGAGTKQAYDQAVATQASAAATVAADQSVLDADRAQLAYTKITAPIDGRLGAIQAVIGNLVNGGTAASATNNLMTITQLQPLKVGFQLPERTLAAVQKAIASGAKLPVHIFQNGTTTELESGNLDFVDSAVDTTSGTIAMSATVENKSLSLWPGQFVDLTITTGILKNVVTVPTVAVQQSQTGSFVWKLKDGKTVAITPVVVAHSEGEKTALASGLNVGEQVVTEGQLKLKEGSQVQVGGKAKVASDSGATDSATPTSVQADAADTPAAADKKNAKKIAQ
jgi:membrane fusion protein, multidrug efflux system